MTPTLQANTVRVKIDPPLPEGYYPIRALTANMLRTGVFVFENDKNYLMTRRTCPHPPGSQLEVLERFQKDCEHCCGLVPDVEITDHYNCKYCHRERTVTVRSNSVDGADWLLEVEP